MIDNKTIRQVVINSKLFPCSGISYHEVTGSICNFKTDLAASLKSCEVTVTPTQAQGTPTPSNPIPIYGHTGLNVVKCGKNFVKTSSDNYIYYGSYYNFTLNNNVLTITGNTLIGFIVPAKPNTTYTASKTTDDANNNTYLRIREYASFPTTWSDESFIVQSVNTTNDTATFTTNSQTKYFLYVIYRAGSSLNITVSNMQVEYGSTATTFEAYNGTTYPVSWASHGTIYGGYYDNDTGEVWATHELITFNGSEDWENYSSQNGFSKTISNMKSGSAMMDGYSNFLSTQSVYTTLGIRFGGNNNKSIYCCHITDNIADVTDVAAWKTYLQSNNLQVCYPLATPVKIATIDPIVINTMLGVNNIWNDVGETTVEYPLSGESCNGIMKFLPIFYPNGKGGKHDKL